MCVPLRKPLFPVNWRLLVKECIANNGISQKLFFFVFLVVLMISLVFNLFLVFLILHKGGVRRERVCDR